MFYIRVLYGIGPGTLLSTRGLPCIRAGVFRSSHPGAPVLNLAVEASGFSQKKEGSCGGLFMKGFPCCGDCWDSGRGFFNWSENERDSRRHHEPDDGRHPYVKAPTQGMRLFAPIVKRTLNPSNRPCNEKCHESSSSCRKQKQEPKPMPKAGTDAHRAPRKRKRVVCSATVYCGVGAI